MLDDPFASEPDEARTLSAILNHKFAPPISSQEYAIMQVLKSFHNRTAKSDQTRHVSLTDSEDYVSFPLMDFLSDNNIEVQTLDEPRHEMITWNPMPKYAPKDEDEAWVMEKRKVGIQSRLHAGVLRFTYEGTDFTIYKVCWYRSNYGQCALYDIVFEGPFDEWHRLTSSGHRLAGDVFSWAGSIQDGIWVYQEGHWSKSQALWNAIQRASWDNVCLDPEFLRSLRRDIRAFFDNAKIYQSLGIAWKRGILLLGPPGNGKTESIKVLLKESDQVALYVKSFGAEGVSQPYLAVNSV